ncbi:hypothetical protein KP509_02G038700 [Ceratopteris richardii]|uniref:Uncharacterized protein n=1 Tax=Ceratopteris richardii TaxID=49495 RepID=A0A8T2V809_CERRI|nr:hypothetical protein KP509_02G038700 [Ceratopteris richardii]
MKSGKRYRRISQMISSGMSWYEWLGGILRIANEALFQRFYTRHLPKRLLLPKLTGLTCIVTGATSGIGLETAKQLAESGAHVVLACRNTRAAETLIQEWLKKTDTALKVEVMQLNLLSLSSVRSFCTAWNARNEPIHVLINNAGICSLGTPQKFSDDGFEEHMQVECLGSVDPDDLNFTSGRREYSSLAAYSGSKLAQIYFTSVLESRLRLQPGIHAMCVNPGIVTTNVTRTLPKVVQASHRQNTFLFFNPTEGSRSVLFCATAQQPVDYANKRRSDNSTLCPLFSSDCKPRMKALKIDELDKVLKVWDKTLELIGVSEDYLVNLFASPLSEKSQ